jgi:hypothetical protein
MTILSNTLADRELNTSHNTRWPSPNHNFVPEYQQSGVPYAASIELDAAGIHQFTFTHVTRWVSISSSQECYINFTDDTADWTDNAKAFLIPANTITRFELKCKSINVKATHENQVIHVLAGLTGVPSQNFPDQTSTNGFFVETT